jgi:SAM-dependent methyltransferase
VPQERLGARLSRALRWSKPVRSIVRSVAGLEAWWFDLTQGVKTAGAVSLSELTLAGHIHSGNDYLAARARNVKRALRELPVQDHSQFTFIDLGSGKGRVLFLAAEYPYRRIQGVEFARELHLQAEENVRTFHGRKQQCRRIESKYMDAAEFEFPEERLVVYMFNPFPAATLQGVLGNLKSSLDRSPREVFLISVYPAELDPVLASLPWLRMVQRAPQYHLYSAVLEDTRVA